MSELTWLCVSLSLASFAAGICLATLILSRAHAANQEYLLARISRLEDSLKQWERERAGSDPYLEN